MVLHVLDCGSSVALTGHSAPIIVDGTLPAYPQRCRQPRIWRSQEIIRTSMMTRRLRLESLRNILKRQPSAWDLKSTATPPSSGEGAGEQERMTSREELKNYQLQLDQVNDGLSVVPDDQELLDLKAELTDLIELLKDQLKAEEAEQEAKQKKWQQKKYPSSTSQTPSRTETPVLSNDEEDTHNESPEPPSKSDHQFKIGDVVSAKWATGDGGYYPAKITQITGSSAHPF